MMLLSFKEKAKSLFFLFQKETGGETSGQT